MAPTDGAKISRLPVAVSAEWSASVEPPAADTIAAMPKSSALCQRTKALRAGLWQAGNGGWDITEERCEHGRAVTGWEVPGLEGRGVKQPPPQDQEHRAGIRNPSQLETWTGVAEPEVGHRKADLPKRTCRCTRAWPL
jgi:hypothetical protein